MITTFFAGAILGSATTILIWCIFELKENNWWIKFHGKKLKQLETISDKEWSAMCRLTWYGQFLNCWWIAK